MLLKLFIFAKLPLILRLDQLTVWSKFVRGFVTHVFKGHGGVVSALAFSYPKQSNTTYYRFCGYPDTNIRFGRRRLYFKWWRKARTCFGRSCLRSSRLDVSSVGPWLISSGRDSVVPIWDLISKNPSTKEKKSNRKTPTLVKTIPILERVKSGLIAVRRPIPLENGTRPNLILHRRREGHHLNLGWE